MEPGRQFDELEDMDDALHSDLSKKANADREQYMKSGGKWPSVYLAAAQKSKPFQNNLRALLGEGHVEVSRAWRAGEPAELGEIANVSTNPGWGKGWAGPGGTVRRFQVPREDVVGVGYHPEGELFVRTHRAKEI